MVTLNLYFRHCELGDEFHKLKQKSVQIEHCININKMGMNVEISMIIAN